MTEVTGKTTKIAWRRDSSVPAGQPAPGSFRCVCGNTITGVSFGSEGEHSCQCGRVWDSRGWLVSEIRDGKIQPGPTRTVKTPTGDCKHCRKPIRQNRGGHWGARRQDDPHPWYCDADPGSEKRHEPAPVAS